MPDPDPGRAYLYAQPGAGKQQQQQPGRRGKLPPPPQSSPAGKSRTGLPRRQAAPASAPVSLSPSPPPSQDGSLALEHQDGGLGRWEAAVGNLEDARVALDTLARAVDDAVYLDEDAYNQVTPTMQFTRTIQAQQRRLADLQHQVDDMQARLQDSEAGRTAAEQRVAEMQQELDNNAVVFKMHYSELLAKNEEIANLKAVIQGLSGK
ncbi:hypothetical protein WJX72_010296 [[Myrmecia] bisecta]|uniref:Uncharacterized protein n=1 Tax=[Myrmecia] bisecta TaxID=41462 RepID=A0AAW1Q0X4_9CHLO